MSCQYKPIITTHLDPVLCDLCWCVQEQVKGSQGAGKVDDALDRGAKADKGEEDKGKAAAKPQLPARPAGKGKGGRR